MKKVEKVEKVSFMKEEAQLPANLLKLKAALPVQTHGVGQLCRPYDTWASVKCAPEHLPSRASTASAGHDLYSVADAVVVAGGSVLIDTGLAIALPKAHYGKIEGRSSLGIKHSVVPFGGIIDEDYRGVIMVKLFNHGPRDYQVKANDIIAQLIIQRYSAPSFQIVQELSSTERASGGFLSTGR